ncbi:MAG: prenyltransferase/squalene oxidase repeat-containing protein, partial [Candidatus Rokuibacteriota bacterium]
MIADAIELLVSTQNADGGWGATPERQSDTETTAVAVMALRAWNTDARPPRVQRGIAWLLRLQKSDGSWPIRHDVEDSSWATALAVLCLASFDEHRRRAQAGARWLLEQRGRG